MIPLAETPVATRTVRFALPDIDEDDIAAVAEVLRGGWLSSGPRCAELEEKFAAYTGAKHALAVNSCTAGLHLALAALGLGAGDEVITTPLTFCATVNAILHTGATPVLADIGPDFNIDPERVRALCTPRTRAILPVHMAGLSCDMDAIWSLARERGLFVVEDAAHAAGTTYQGIPTGGGASDAVAFSFYATKNLTTGEGGLVATSSASLYERMRMLCLHGIDRHAWNRYTSPRNWHYDVSECGFKYNLSDINAALGVTQLARLDRMNRRRAHIAAQYSQALRDLPELQLPPTATGDSVHAWHLYILRLNTRLLAIDRAGFVAELQRLGTHCSVHFIPIPLHSAYRGFLEMPDPCMRALAEYERMFSLPLCSAMSNEDVEHVIESVRKVAVRHRKCAR